MTMKSVRYTLKNSLYKV